MQIYDIKSNIQYDEIITMQKTYQMRIYDMIYDASLECNTTLNIMWYYRQKKQLFQRKLLGELSKKCEVEAQQLSKKNNLPFLILNYNYVLSNEINKCIGENSSDVNYIKNNKKYSNKYDKKNGNRNIYKNIEYTKKNKLKYNNFDNQIYGTI